MRSIGFALLLLSSQHLALASGPARDAASAPTVSTQNIVDLTHTLTPEFPYIPVPGITFPFKATPIATIPTMGVAANKWEIHEHLGTQIDAPSHFVDGGTPLDQMPVRNFIAPLAVIDIRDRARRDADASVTVDDILAWEAKYGRLPAGAAVFMYSGWEERIHDAAAFINAEGPTAAGELEPTMHFPGFSPEATAFLASERDVVGIGVDTLSLDPGKDKQYRAHKSWLAAGKWGVECVANLGKVPASGATVFVGATKVGGATGGPVRLIATFPSAAQSAIAPTLTADRLVGNWKSPAPESAGPGAFTTREFQFSRDRWRVEARFYGDQAARTPLFAFVAEGPYALQDTSSQVEGANDAVFSFDRKTLTLLTSDPATLRRFGFDGCGLKEGTPTDISANGCSFFAPIAHCQQEHDLVQLEGDDLRLGMRPADRNMCAPAKRPKALGAPLVRLAGTGEPS
ncbi:cyclase family protein [Montanilutibacter psychrotolerans]|uniref:cyclase family protein n=1 Tax=Montanilutibacter psychrotolerans TaxID=1327343 RepID=UPI001CC20811|nr:cyclase family protein [Lysobacter psychrotolerans]